MRESDFGGVRRSGGVRAAAPIAIIALQLIAALYFVYDSLADLSDETSGGVTLELVMECFAAFSLMAGVVFGLRHLSSISSELGSKRLSLERAQSAFADHLTPRFAEWRLTASEREVAMFALKGLEISEIARLRGAAAGTVRAQLSQIYAKAQVISQAMLVSLFIEDLLG